MADSGGVTASAALLCLTPHAAAVADRAAAFNATALPHLPAVARVARALAANEADADDLVQETFLRALRHWDTFVPGTDCRRWLATICRNVHFASYAKAKRETAVDDADLEALASVQVHRDARALGLDGLFERTDLGPAIVSAIASLEPEFRAVETLVDVEGFSYEDAAGVLGIPVGTVRSRLFRARRQLQQLLVAHARDAGFPAAAPTDPTPRIGSR
jgi:RNA polymerase sigma-70 factor (ECF subfamily)